MTTLLTNEQTEDILNMAYAVECCATLNVPFVMDDGQGGTFDVDAHTMKVTLQYQFGMIGWNWPTITEQDLRDFADQNDIVGRW